jgi:hypothetical protein
MTINQILLVVFIVLFTLTIVGITIVAVTSDENIMNWTTFTISKAIATNNTIQLTSVVLFAMLAPILATAIIRHYGVHHRGTLTFVVLLSTLLFCLVPAVSMDLSTVAHLLIAMTLFVLLGVFMMMVTSGNNQTLVVITSLYVASLTMLLAAGVTGYETPIIGTTEYVCLLLFLSFLSILAATEFKNKTT